MNQANKNIVWLTPGFAANESDTACIPTLQDLAKCFPVHNDFELTIVAMHYPFDEKEYTWNSIPVNAIAGKNKKGWQRLKTYYRTWQELKKLHRQKKFDVLHSFWIGDTSLVAQYFCKRYKIKHVVTIMGQDALGNSYFRWSWFNNMKLVSLTPYSAHHFKKASHLETISIPFGLTEQTIMPPTTRTTDIISVGSIIPLKNHLHFLKLVTEIRKTIPHVQALIVGEQHDLNYLKLLQNFIAENNLHSNVQLIAKVSREESLQYMAASKILIHSSHYESQGMVMLEALANGCKVSSSGKGVVVENEQFELLPTNMEDQVNTITKNIKEYEAYSSFVPLKIEDTYQRYKKIYNEQ